MKRIQFVSDRLVEQIIAGEKTASVTKVGEVDLDEDEYNHGLVVGDQYQVFDSDLKPRCIIRITGMELSRWDSIPDKLWQGETNKDADEFRADHIEWFDNPGPDYEFVAYYFQTIPDKPPPN